MSANTTMHKNRIRKIFMLLTDFGFLLYWTVTILHVVPDAWLFKDHDNPIIASWNWSFLPLDIMASCAGLVGVFLTWKGTGRHQMRGETLVTISLVLTMVAGLQALSFWAVRGDFDVFWWLSNGFLLVWPLFFLIQKLKTGERKEVK